MTCGHLPLFSSLVANYLMHQKNVLAGQMQDKQKNRALDYTHFIVKR